MWPEDLYITSYGSPSGGPSDFSNGSSLSFLSISQRVSITVPSVEGSAEGSPGIGLFYSRDEFDDVVRRLSANPCRPLRLHTDVKDYVFELTSSHPGAVDGVIRMVEQVLQPSFYITSTKLSQAYRSDLEHLKIDEATKGHTVDLLDDEEGSFRYLAYTGVHRLFVNTKKSLSKLLQR